MPKTKSTIMIPPDIHALLDADYFGYKWPRRPKRFFIRLPQTRRWHKHFGFHLRLWKFGFVCRWSRGGVYVCEWLRLGPFHCGGYFQDDCQDWLESKFGY